MLLQQRWNAGARHGCFIHGRTARLLHALALLLVLCASCFLPLGALADEPFVFVDEPLSPLSIGDLGGEARGGKIPDMLKEVFGRLGLEARLELMPFARALRTVRAGRADGMPLLVHTADRERFLRFTNEVVRDREFFYYRPDRLGAFAWDGYGDLEGLVVGLVRGYEYTPSFMDAVRQGRVAVEYAPDSGANLRKLVGGRVDLVLEGGFQFMAVLDGHPQWRRDIRRARPEVGSYAWCMGLSRTSPRAEALVPDINRVLEAMHRDGTLDRIFGVDGE